MSQKMLRVSETGSPAVSKFKSSIVLIQQTQRNSVDGPHQQMNYCMLL